jgi:porin
MKGNNSLTYYTFDLKSKWAVYNAPEAGTAGWISSKVEAKTGLGSPGHDQSAKSNLGTITDPTGIWSGINGVRMPELAWQQSMLSGEAVVVAGVVNQGSYLDQNAYAQSGRSQFFNSALINSSVLPLTSYNFGLNLQWQHVNEWYAMVGASAGDAPAGQGPWTDFSWANWSVVGELGYAPKDFCGFGPGIYRVQPFLAEAGGPTQGGLCFNLQQQLGQHSPFGWFGRFGFGGSAVSGDAEAQIGTGFAWQGPFRHPVLQRKSNDRLGVGFIWSQPSESSHTVYHENEYTLETAYTMQLTPMIKLEPNVQVVWNPAFNPDAGPVTIFQIQLALAW